MERNWRKIDKNEEKWRKMERNWRKMGKNGEVEGICGQKRRPTIFFPVKN